jgi:hypothetical protein
MDVFCFHNLKQVEWWADELEALSLVSRRKDPFSTLGFIKNNAAHPDWYPGDKDAQLWFLLAVEHGAPVGYLALRRKVERVLGVTTAKLEFFVSHDNDCPQLVARPEDEPRVSAAFYEYLISRGDEWSFLEFHQQDPGSALTPPPPGSAFDKYFARTFPTKENNTIPILWPTLDAYFKALSTKWRGDVRRKARRILAAGKLTWLESDDPQTTPTLLELLRTIESRSWKSQHAIALGSHPDRLAYFRGLLAADQPMRIRISVLMLDGVPIAGSICGHYADSMYGLVVLFDDRAESLSPGVMVQMMMLRTAISRKARALNLLAGYAYYKSRWLAQELPTRSGQLYRIGKPYFWKAVLGELKRQIEKRIAPPAEDKQQFNPERRVATEGKETKEPKDGAPAKVDLTATHEERSQIKALLAALEALPVERLDAEALTAVIPFGDAAAAPVSRAQKKSAQAPLPAPQAANDVVVEAVAES